MAKMARKSTNKIFNVSDHAFTRSMASVSGTAIVSEKENYDYYSIKNTIPDKISGKVCSKVAYEIASGLKDIIKTSNIVFVGKTKDTGEKYFYAQFQPADATTSDDEISWMILPDSKIIYGTDLSSNTLYSLIAYMDICNFILKGKSATPEDAEIFELMAQMNFSTSIIDGDQLPVFVPLCDSTYFSAKSLNGAKMIQLSDSEIANKAIEDGEIKYNLIGLIAEEDVLTFEVTNTAGEAEEVTVPAMKKPKIAKKTRMGKKGSKETDYASQDYSLMSDAEAKSLPEPLQLMRQKAIDFYEDNKQFLTEEQWSIIQSFKRGRLWKLGCYGPSATGKTSFIKCMAGALRLPFAIVVGSKGMDETKLFGSYVFVDGETVFRDGPLTEMVKYGGLFLLDEENMVAPEVISSMNSLLDDTRVVTLDDGTVIHAHPNFRYCEAMNMAYAGTVEQNLSHESRVQIWLKFKGYDEVTEAKLVAKETGIAEDIALKMIQVKNAAMDIIANGDGDDTTQRVDLRSAIAWADRTIDCGGDVIRAALTTVLSPLVKEDDQVKSSATVDEYKESTEIASMILEEIQDKFKRTVVEKREYNFGAYKI